jgi:diguanylate cyclase (GGDEF)-like protein
VARTDALGRHRVPARSREPRRRPQWGRILLWSVYAIMGCYLIGYLTTLITQPPDMPWPMFDDWWVDGFEIAGAALCIARGLRRKRRGSGRAVALTLGLSLLMWAIGDLVLTLESMGGRDPGTPSLADVCWLAFFPLAYVALVLFMRGEVRQLSSPNWLDGAVAGTGAAAVCAAFAFHSIHSLTGGSSLQTVTNLAYPVGDLLLLCLVVGGSTVLAGRRRTPWLLIAVGIIANVAGDTANLFDSSLGHTGFILDAMAWPTSILMLSMSVWVRQRPSDPFAEPKPATFVIPGISTLAALSVLFLGNLQHTSRIAFLLSTATLLLVGVRLVVSVRGMRALSQERRHQSLTDELTGLGNRRCLSLVLDAFFGEFDRSDGTAEARTLAFLFIDLDHFKEINDTFGHPAGDQLLRQIGPRLSNCLRDSDLLVRLGGDEFVVLLLDADAGYATTVAGRLSAVLSQPFELDAIRATVSASIGIALAPGDATDAAGLLWCADIAMYRAKLGGVPFAVHQPDLDKNGNRLQLLEELRTAITQGQLVLHYQPQLDLRSGAIVAVEALVRWAHPELGLLPPLEFLPFAEDAGLMRPITRFVLREAIAQCAQWRQDGKMLTVSVNISATNLGDPHLRYLVRELLDIHGVPPQALVLEVTETSVIADFEVAARVIQELRDLGIVVSVDDFGAGFTSLAHLSSLAVKELKLDRVFISRLTDSGGARDLNLVRATIELGHAMGLRIVAEGIEDLATLELLSELGCDLGQGYFIGKPKPADLLAFRPQPAAPAAQIPHQPTGPQHAPQLKIQNT